MTPPCRLGYVITDLQIGGVPLHLLRLATRLPRDEFEPTVISLADVGPVGEMLREAGIAVLACGARGVWDVRALGRLWRFLRGGRFDLVHSLLFHANMAVRLTGPLAGIPTSRILCEIQTVEVERTWHLWADTLTCRLCRLEIANSASVLRHLHRKAHIPLSRLCCQWGATDVAAFWEATTADRVVLGVPADEPLIIWTGRFDPVKGFEEMIAAFARVCQSRPAHLLLVGDGPYRGAVEGLIRGHQLVSRVHCLGYRTDIASLLRAADAFLFCSRTEGMPNALLEAMAAGLPIVTTSAPGCRDLIQDGRTGLTAPVGDVPEIYRQLLRLLNDRPFAQQLGSNAHSWAAQYADIRTLGHRWVQFYKAVKNSI